ncbi:MAG: hypothetical protein ACPGYJ_07680, partial [bacterium]
HMLAQFYNRGTPGHTALCGRASVPSQCLDPQQGRNQEPSLSSGKVANPSAPPVARTTLKSTEQQRREKDRQMSIKNQNDFLNLWSLIDSTLTLQELQNYGEKNEQKLIEAIELNCPSLDKAWAIGYLDDAILLATEKASEYPNPQEAFKKVMKDIMTDQLAACEQIHLERVEATMANPKKFQPPAPDIPWVDPRRMTPGASGSQAPMGKAPPSNLPLAPQPSHPGAINVDHLKPWAPKPKPPVPKSLPAEEKGMSYAKTLQLDKPMSQAAFQALKREIVTPKNQAWKVVPKAAPKEIRNLGDGHKHPHGDPQALTEEMSRPIQLGESAIACILRNKSEQLESKHCVKTLSGDTWETGTSSQALDDLETCSIVSQAGSELVAANYGPIRKPRERSASVAPKPEIREYETDNNLRPMSARKKRSGDQLPDLGVSGQEMREIMGEPVLKTFFEACLQHMKAGIQSGKYKDETSAFAALVLEMDVRCAEEPPEVLKEKKRCLSAALAALGVKGDPATLKESTSAS